MSNTTPIIPANAREVHMIEFISCLEDQVHNAQDVLKDRLKTVPDAWRNYRLALTSLSKAVDAIYKTLPPKTMRHMQRMNDHGQVVIRPKPLVPLHDDVRIVLSDDLMTLVNTAITVECAMCVKNKHEQKKCPLHKAMIDIAPPEALANDGLCPYTHVVLGNDLGDYIQKE